MSDPGASYLALGCLVQQFSVLSELLRLDIGEPCGVVIWQLTNGRQSSWNRLDLTFSANGADTSFIGDGGNYLDELYY